MPASVARCARASPNAPFRSHLRHVSRNECVPSGAYYAHQYLDLEVELPTVSSWISDRGHKRRLLRQLTGGAAAASEFNGKLQEELRSIGAEEKFTVYCLRALRISRGHQDPNMRGDDVRTVSGHVNGSHDTNYGGVSGAGVLEYAADVSNSIP